MTASPSWLGQTVLIPAVLACVVLAVAGQLAARERGMMPELLARGAHVTLAGAVTSEPRAMTAGLGGAERYLLTVRAQSVTGTASGHRSEEIGRASCRERVF